MNCGRDENILFGIIDTYNAELTFFKGGDAYAYASGFAVATEALGYRIEWNHEHGMSLQIESVICDKRWPDGSKRTVGVTKEGDLILSSFRARLVKVGEKFGKNNSSIYSLNDCQLYGHGLPLVEFYDMTQDPAQYPGGQVIADYYASKLLQHDRSVDEGVEEIGRHLRSIAWDNEEFGDVIDWLAYRLDAQGYDWRHTPDG